MSESKKNSPKMEKIRLPLVKGNTADVFVSVNNYNCVIKRGQEVEVPEFVVEVLEHQQQMQAQRMAFEEKAQK